MNFRLVFLLCILLFVSKDALSQNSVGIGTETPNPRAVLELIAVSNNQGFLAPRLTTAERNSFGASLTDADNGMFVFDSQEGKFYVWFGGAWNVIGATALTAGEGISLDGQQITNTGDTDPSDDLTSATSASGDVTGTFENLVVSGLGGRPLDLVTEPSAGFTLVWNGTEWRLQLPAAASQTVTPTANLLSTSTQAALEELQTEILAVVDTDDQTAGEVVVTPSGNLLSTDVQASLEELQSDIDGWIDTDNQTAVEVAYTDNQSTGQTDVQGALDYLLTTGDGDNNATNEIQDLTISGNTVGITGGTGFELAPTAPANGQVLKWTGTAWDVGADEGIVSENDPLWQADKTILGSAGTINDAANLLDWSQLKNVPAAFADGADDTGGDMLSSIYDTDLDNTVDNAALVNNLTVETAVPLAADFTDDQGAAEVSYDNGVSGIVSTDVQSAIDELSAGMLASGDMLSSVYDTDLDNTVDNAALVNNLTVETAVPLAADFTDDQGAAEVSYDNGVSGIVSTDVQSAIDELSAGMLASGDMLSSVYDTDLDNTVDNAALVNNLTVETAVPLAADFTDDQGAAEVPFVDNQSTGQTDVQGAIDYLLTTGDGDNDPANEIQNLSITGNSIGITGGTGFELAPTTPVNGQVLKFNGSVWDVGIDEGITTVTSAEIIDFTIGANDLAANSVGLDALDEANIPLNSLGPATSDLSLGTYGITDLAEPTNLQDAATKAYVDGVQSATTIGSVLINGNDAGTADLVNLGNVGIGTSTPGYNLEVEDVTPSITVSSTGTGVSAASSLRFENADVGLVGMIQDAGSADNLEIVAANALVFNTSFSDRMIISPNGKVGIGTSQPQSDLQIGDDFHLFHFDDGATVEGEMLAENLYVDGNILRYTLTGPASAVLQSGGNMDFLVGTSQPAGTDATSAMSLSSALSIYSSRDAKFHGAVDFGDVRGTPEEGMLRYTGADGFQGYDGIAWNSLEELQFPVSEIINEGSSAPFYIENQGSGGVAEFNLNNTGAFGNALTVNSNSNETGARALRVQHYGLGGALEVEAFNSLNNQPAILAKTSGTAPAGVFELNNASGTHAALRAEVTAGDGTAIEARTSGAGAVADFHNTNQTTTGAALVVDNDGTGSVALLRNSNNATQPAVSVLNNGTGPAIDISSGGNTTRFGTDANFGGRISIGHFAPSVSLDINATDAIRVPVGTTGQRPGSPLAGMLRYNSSLIRFEAFDGTAWSNLTSPWLYSGADLFFNTGNVGIGISSPAEMLDVNGSVQVSGTGEFKYASPKTRRYSVTPADFKLFSEAANDHELRYSSGVEAQVYSLNNDESAKFGAPVHLPDGAVITLIEVVGRNFSTSIAGVISFVEKSYSTASTPTQIASIPANTAGVTTFPNSSVFTIDNNAYNYLILVETTSNGASITGVRITYTVSNAD